tara:strand:+ start:14737 stop:15273 length:537 start_codon:yes stop_codon:yes gene_type:complete
MKRTLVFDTETTGLIANSLIRKDHQPRIIEFYGCIVDQDGEVIQELEFLCNPGIKLPPIITKITGLTDADLKDAKPFEEYAEDIISLVQEADSIVAHNLSYDLDIVNFEMDRCDKKAKWPLCRICTVEETEWLKGHRLKLADLFEHLTNEQFKDAHRARNDVKALTRCFNELRKQEFI